MEQLELPFPITTRSLLEQTGLAIDEESLRAFERYCEELIPAEHRRVTMGLKREAREGAQSLASRAMHSKMFWTVVLTAVVVGVIALIV